MDSEDCLTKALAPEEFRRSKNRIKLCYSQFANGNRTVKSLPNIVVSKNRIKLCYSQFANGNRTVKSLPNIVVSEL